MMALLLTAVLLPLGALLLVSVAVLLVPFVPIAIIVALIALVAWGVRNQQSGPEATEPTADVVFSP
ncbi:MAG TPA: hypothetical protein VGD37_27025 [Kofleriaceae bacterium]